MKFAGTWHIYEMEAWDEEYFNMEVQAYVKVDTRGLGDFQFGLVSGQFHGEVVPVESSMIQAVRYDAKTRTLEVVFNSGQTYY